MKTLVCVEPHVLRVEDRPNPVRSDGEVLIRIRRVGICGTDYHIYKGTQPYLSYPRLIGHELAGEVAEAGADSAFTVGQVVTVNPYLTCGHCIACRRGKPNCCANIRVLGVHIDGGMSEFLAVPETAVIDADGFDMDQAAMVEFLADGRRTRFPGWARHHDADQNDRETTLRLANTNTKTLNAIAELEQWH